MDKFPRQNFSDKRKHQMALHDTEGYAEAYEERVSNWTLQHKYFLAARWGMKFNGLFLDYGCGTGLVARNLVNIGREVVGVDISKNMCKIAKKKFGAQVVVGDCLNLPFKNRAFSVVCISLMLHHLPDQLERAFSEIGRCAKKAVCMYEPSTTPPALIFRLIWLFNEEFQWFLLRMRKLLCRLRNKPIPEKYGFIEESVKPVNPKKYRVFEESERPLNPEKLKELCEKEGFQVSQVRFFNPLPLINTFQFLPENLRKHLVFSMISFRRGIDVEIIAERYQSA